MARLNCENYFSLFVDKDVIDYSQYGLNPFGCWSHEDLTKQMVLILHSVVLHALDKVATQYVYSFKILHFFRLFTTFDRHGVRKWHDIDKKL